jgi:hypothetical protein
MHKLLFISVLIVFIFASCKSKEKMADSTGKSQTQLVANGSPQVVVYKTTHDYSHLVPVIMNSEKTKIISYPAPGDVFLDGKLALPVSLKNGYLLDNKGITENVVFTNYTYESYSKMKEAPNLKEILANIVDKYPLNEMILCGQRTNFRNVVDEVNSLIDNGFPNCKKIEIISMQINY